MNFIPDPKEKLLSPNHIEFDVGGMSIKRPKKTLPYNVSFNGATFDVVPSPSSERESVKRSEKEYGVLVWDVQVGNLEDKDKLKEGKVTMKDLLQTNNKATLHVSVPRDTKWLEKMVEFDMHAKEKLVDAMIASKQEPFTGEENRETLLKKCKFLVINKNEKYNPNFPIVIQRKFDAGFLTTGFNEETGSLQRNADPDFGWENMDEYLKRGAVLHKATGTANYASVTVRDGEVVSINIQFQVKRLVMAHAPEAKDEVDSDEEINASPKRPNVKMEAASDMDENPTKKIKVEE